MDEQLRLLVELQKMDSILIKHSMTIRTIPDRMSTAEKPLKEAQAGLDRAQEEFKAFEQKKREKEREAEENNERIQKLKDHANDIKDNKAYQAHLKEIDTLEVKTVSIEDEVLVFMENMEAEAQKVKAAEDAFKTEQAKAGELKRELDGEVESARKELDSMKATRTVLAEKVDPEHYKEYMKLLGSKGGVAITMVEGETCGGCNMNIMPQLVVEIKKGSGVIQCPQCRRILYHEPAAEEQDSDES